MMWKQLNQMKDRSWRGYCVCFSRCQSAHQTEATV